MIDKRHAMPIHEKKQKRWRLILGPTTSESTPLEKESYTTLTPDEVKIDNLLTALYNSDRKGSLGSSSPNVNQWLGDIRTYFPNSVVQIMQKDVIEKINLKKILSEPELLNQLEPDVNLVATILNLKKNLPEKTKETAREVVRKVVQKLEEQLKWSFQITLKGQVVRNRSQRSHKKVDLDWNKVILKNLYHYQPEYKTIIPEKLYSFSRADQEKKDVIICLDQSGSMASSVVYTGIIASVMSSIKIFRTRLIAFDTNIIDLTSVLHDPIEVLFGVQLGGGTHITKALTYAQKLVDEPRKTIMILISDLFEGADEELLKQKAKEIKESGVQCITLLALSDEGHPAYDQEVANYFSAALGIPTFACTPHYFPELMSQVLKGNDIKAWALNHQKKKE